MTISRRGLLSAGLALPAALHPGPAGLSAQTPAPARPPIWLSDMHFHSFFGDSIYHSRPVGRMLGDGGATLVAWAISADSPWFDHRRTFQQTGDPPPGAARLFFERQLGRIKAHMAEQGLRPCLVPEDVDRAIAGEPRIVLALEGTTFIERVEDVEVAYDAGIRHVQLVHFTRSPLGDFQTAPPRHGGLTPLGQDVVRACNRLGMLIDLAHATPETVAGALATSRVPMVWSHGSVTAGPRPQPGLVVWRARQLPLADARAIASAGGVVGLWVFTHDIGRTVDDYARRVLQLADWLGDEHVGFGTDINGLAHNFVLSTYSEVRQAVDLWLRNGVPEQRIRRIAGLNYARVLRQALAARQG